MRRMEVKVHCFSTENTNAALKACIAPSTVVENCLTKMYRKFKWPSAIYCDSFSTSCFGVYNGKSPTRGQKSSFLKKSKQRKNKKIFSDLHLKRTAQSFEATFILFLCSQLGTPFHKANCSMAAKQGDQGLCRQDFDQQMCHHWEKWKIQKCLYSF